MSKRTHPSTTTTTTSKKPRRSNRVARQKYGPCWSGTTTDLNTTLVLDTRKYQASHYDAKKSRLNLLQDVWEYKIVPLLNMTELAVLRPTCTWFEQRWQDFCGRNQIRVPQDVPTIDQALEIASILSEQKEFTKESPLVVLLSEGVHEVMGSWIANDEIKCFKNTLGITCSNISFLGYGKDKTTVHGGFGVSNKKNVTLQSLTLMSPNGNGLYVQEEASVEMIGSSVKHCGFCGISVDKGASVKATQCEFSENKQAGVYLLDDNVDGFFTDCTFHHNGNHGVCADGVCALVELRGEQTEIHHNSCLGLVAVNNATINMYVPSRSITAVVHDNGDRDLYTSFSGGKIQSQLSSSSLELTVIHRDGQSV